MTNSAGSVSSGSDILSSRFLSFRFLPVFLISLVLLCAPLFATTVQPFSDTALNPRSTITSNINLLTLLAAAFAIFMVVLAAIAYLLGPLLGTEINARAVVWANSMITAAGVAFAILIVTYVILPSGASTSVRAEGLGILFSQLADSAKQIFFMIILFMVLLTCIIYLMGQSMGAETRARATVYANATLGATFVLVVIYVVLFDIIGYFQGSDDFFAPLGLQTYGTTLMQIAALVGAFILLVYAFSKILRVPEWEAYLNVELSNLLSSYVMAVFVVGLFLGSNAIATAMFPGTVTSSGSHSLPNAAMSLMSGYVSQNLLDGIYDIYTIQSCTSVLNTFSKRLGEFAVTQTYKVFPGIDTFVSLTNVIGYGTITIYGSINAQVALLQIIDSITIPFLLPAGIILRFIPATREAGAFMIALAFGFQIVFPLTYLINMDIYRSVGFSGYHSNQFLIGTLCGPFKYGFWGYVLNPKEGPFASIPGIGTFASGAGSTALTKLSALISEGFLNALTMAEFTPFMDYVASMSLLGLFMPALSTLITIAAINTITKFIILKS
ncbi:hypothetical protein HY990_06555 [Candidatus Micrarchaeota archaeon]|nr:hypothetical protein [Candidatus Micrarchaeota archaeon]